MSDDLSEDEVLGAYLYGPGEAERRWTGDTSTYFLATGGTTDGAFCLIDETAHRGEAVPLHRHHRDLESIYVVEGRLSLFLDSGDAQMAEAGAFAHFPAGTVHGFRVESDTARYLLMTTPHHGKFYRAISRPSGHNGEKADPPIDEATIIEACRLYDVEFIGPFPSVET